MTKRYKSKKVGQVTVPRGLGKMDIEINVNNQGGVWLTFGASMTLALKVTDFQKLRELMREASLESILLNAEYDGTPVYTHGASANQS